MICGGTHSRSPGRSNSASTLIELLVVVAIIAHFVAALLLPALKNTRAKKPVDSMLEQHASRSGWRYTCPRTTTRSLIISDISGDSGFVIVGQTQRLYTGGYIRTPAFFVVRHSLQGWKHSPNDYWYQYVGLRVELSTGCPRVSTVPSQKIPASCAGRTDSGSFDGMANGEMDIGMVVDAYNERLTRHNGGSNLLFHDNHVGLRRLPRIQSLTVWTWPECWRRQ